MGDLRSSWEEFKKYDRDYGDSCHPSPIPPNVAGLDIVSPNASSSSLYFIVLVIFSFTQEHSIYAGAVL